MTKGSLKDREELPSNTAIEVVTQGLPGCPPERGTQSPSAISRPAPQPVREDDKDQESGARGQQVSGLPHPGPALISCTSEVQVEGGGGDDGTQGPSLDSPAKSLYAERSNTELHTFLENT